MTTLSRTQRWAKGVAEAQEKFQAYKDKMNDLNNTIESEVNELNDLAGEFNNALGELRDIQDEYQDWQSNLPENLQDSPVAEKLDAVMNIDLSVEIDEDLSWDNELEDKLYLDDAEASLEEADSAELPLGFGRD
jgi:uncharacterized phage infection (PIP) family protein YhgE